MTNNSNQCNICVICNKKYSSRQSLWNHNNKFHKQNLTNHNPNDDYNVHSQENSVQNDNHFNNHTKNPKVYSCKNCHKQFSKFQNRWRHEKKCNNFVDLEKENLLLKETLKKQTDEITQIKSLMIEQNTNIKDMISDLINKNCKVHPKTLQKINKQLIGDNNTINETTNNNTVNNNITYNIIALGHENLTEVFSKKEKMNILKYKYGSLSQLVEYAHFNDKYPQFKNILITNTQNSIAYKHNPKNNQFVAVKKDDLLEDIVDARMCDINSFYEELEGELDEKTKEIMDKLKEQIEHDPAYRDLKKNDIKLIIYNNRKKVFKNNSKLKEQKEINKELKKEINKEIEV